jgi:Mn2+/Fe2+ NRAMP family transporter
MGWIVVISIASMMVYVTIAARIGVSTRDSLGTLIARYFGRWLSIAIGCAIFFIASAFQFTNNLGIYSAVESFVNSPSSGSIAMTATILLNVVTVGFLFGFRRLYRVLEVMMTALVILMIIAFAVNLIMARPDLISFGKGLLPLERSNLDISVLGLVATTFSIAAAFFQTYLVQQKGWGPDDLKRGLFDARVAAITMGIITIMLVTTAAAVLKGQKLESVGDVAIGLRPLFGSLGASIFCIGLFCAAYSSFVVNSMVGGFVMSDGLGLSCNSEDRVPRFFTVAVLLLGMLMAIWIIQTGVKPVAAIVFGQAVTVLAAPALAMLLWWLSNRKDLLGPRSSGWLTNMLAAFGFLLLLGMSYRTAVYKVWPEIVKLF